jgi:hypothetical protein
MSRSLIALAATGAISTMMIAALSSRPVSPAGAAVAQAAAPQPGKSGADAKHPVVLELFQSQGCSSCPPANAQLDVLANRPEVLALNFSVTYWDQLGWKDIYGQQAFTDRQWDYSRAQGRGGVQTPQMIVNGRVAVLGSYRAEIDNAIAANNRGSSGPALAATDSQISVGSARTAGSATVWLVDYDPRTLNVPIRNGENGGRTLPHRDIVKRLTAIGTWTGTAGMFARKPALPNTVQAVLVQMGRGGAIIAATRL